MSEQLSLFDKIENNGITIKEASIKAKVSDATIRNWIKTKYLIQLTNGLISNDSFDYFINHVAGNEKLNSRANKSKKDNHDHLDLTDNILEKLNKDNNKIDMLGNEYENSLSDSYRNKEGIYYTPQQIVKDLLKEFESIDKSNLTFCDPSCGSGNFIIEAINIGFKPENVYGFDIDPIAVEITKKRIEEKTGYISENIICTDFLNYSLIVKETKFDFIFTNPPWGKKINKDEKETYGNILSAGKCLDTSALFFFASIKCLNPDGFIGFLLPEAFFNISIFENARKKALTLNILRLVDYGKAFNGLVTRAQAIVIKNNKNESHKINCEYNNEKYIRSNKSFLNLPKSIFNFYCSETDSEIIEKLYSYPYITLKNNAKWGLGIVTGNNMKFSSNKPEVDFMPVFKGADITKNRLKEPSVFIPKDLSLYQQVAPKELYEAKEKIIYKFISSKLCFFSDTQQRYILNSANMLILGKDFPLTSRQLSMLFNSEIINWLFSKIFNTHKILRGDLEMLPVHYDYFKTNNDFNEEKYLDYLKITKDSNGTYRTKE